jgi:NADH:ubiquinone oxidoreductase subunit 6 (subunit J)
MHAQAKESKKGRKEKKCVFLFSLSLYLSVSLSLAQQARKQAKQSKEKKKRKKARKKIQKIRDKLFTPENARSANTR